VDSVLNPGRVVQQLTELRALTDDATGAHRVAWSPGWEQAREYVRGLVSDLPVKVERDAASNVWFTLEGDSDRALILGSHLDSVPDGGWLDGPLGVLAGVEVLRRLVGSGRRDLTVHVVDWADEEGITFGLDHIGASSCTGIVDAAQLDALVSRDGEPFAELAPRYGFDLARFQTSGERLRGVGAYLELHIEQGPVLERRDLPLAAVSGTVGVERYRVTFSGVTTHAGSTPMADRFDALVAAARFALGVREVARSAPPAVATVGAFSPTPGVATAVAGKCDVTVDLRHPEAEMVRQLLDALRNASEVAAGAEGVTVAWTPLWRIDPTHFSPTLVQMCADAVAEVSGETHVMPSGALHDAAVTERSGIPSVMMFVQSRGGLSHTVEEDTAPEHLELAVRALDTLATKTLDWLAQSAPQ
jgi:N-carbamoyl-L-amino-acid hydrolase